MKRKTALFLAIIFLSGFVLAHAGENLKKPIRISYLQNDIHHLACWVALEKGFFIKEGLNVEVAGIFKAGPETMSAFTAGCLDMAYVGEAPSTTAVANRTVNIVVVAQVNTEGSAIVVRRSSEINNISDLAGKTVAIPGHSTVQDFLLRKSLKKSGIPLKDANIIVVKPPEMIVALRTNQIEAFIAWEPYPSKAITMGVGRILATSHAIWPNHPCCVLVVDSKFFKANPNKVKGMVRAHVNATHYIHENKGEAARIGVKYTGMDIESVRLAMKNVFYTHELSIDGEKEYVRFLSDLKYIKIDDPQAFVDLFINPDILKEIVSQ